MSDATDRCGVGDARAGEASAGAEACRDAEASVADASAAAAWFAAMRRGDFSQAWRISDAYLRALRARERQATSEGEARAPGRRWTGESLAGKRVLVCCRHGLGDTIQFIRFAAPLRRIARRVTVQAQPELVSLIARVDGVDAVLPLRAGAPAADFDVAIEVMELAHACRADARLLQSLPVPYLAAAAAPRRGRPRERQVGVVWSAGAWAPQRSIPYTELAPLARLPATRLYALQRGAAATQAARIPAIDISSDDVEQTAATLRSLDLLISIDSFPAHLAGALGVKVWLLLAQPCDWRWMENGESTIWYPTMTLFRQRRGGEWRPVVEAVLARLRDGD